MKRLAIVVSHPIQYQAPLYRRLAASDQLDLEVLFLDDHGVEPSFDPGFDREVRYDVPLTEGFPHRFVRNWSPRPSIHTFSGLVHPGLARVIAERSFDAVAVHGYAHASDWIAFATAAAVGVPYVLRGETQEAPRSARGSAGWRLRNATIGAVVRHASSCLAIGRRNAGFYASLGARSEQIGWAPYSVDNAAFASLGREGAQERSARLGALGVDPALPVVLFAAKLLPRKRILDLIAACDLLDGDASLVVIGDGSQREEVAEAARSRPWMRALGFVNQTEIGRWYGVADIFVLPSDYETWGLGVNEAMAAGAVPVVSDVVGCGPDLVDDGAGGIFRVGDIKDLARAIAELLDPETRATARAIGAERVARYDIEDTAVGFERAVAAR